MDTDRVYPRIGSGRVRSGHELDSIQFWRVGRVAGHTYFYRIFMHNFLSFVFLLLSLNLPKQHRPVRGSISDNQRLLQVITRDSM